MFLLRFIILIVFCVAFFLQNALCAVENKISDIIIDNSDRLVLIKGDGSFKNSQTSSYVPVPNSSRPSINLINNLTFFTLSNPYRFVIDIPNSNLIGASRTYKLKNSTTIKEITLSQFSTSPNVVRAVFSVNSQTDLAKFKVFTNGEDIIVKYKNSIIDNSLQYKFFTPQGDQDSSIKAQNTSMSVVYNNNNETKETKPKLQNKYYLGQINQNSDGLILKGVGAISLIKPVYNESNTKAVLYLDSASLSPKYENKSFNIPSSQNNKAMLTLSTYNSKRVKIELEGNSLRDYRFILSSDGQSLYISHRTYVLNNNISAYTSKVLSYKTTQNSNGYWLFDMSFLNPVVYDAFELNGNFYLDIYNLNDYNYIAFNQALEKSNIKVNVEKISKDKIRYTIPLSSLNFSYANVESNAKSIKLCFKQKTQTQIVHNQQNQSNATQNNTIASSNTKNPIIPISNSNPNPNEVQNPKQEPNININPNINPSTIPNINPNKNNNENIKVTKPIDSKNSEIIIQTQRPTKVTNQDPITYIPKKDKKEVPKPQRRKTQISSMKKVVIDPGHGGADSGAVSGGVYEKNLNLKIALMLEEKLNKKNIYTYMTRSNDTTLSLEDRTTYSNEIQPDIYVSIHSNSTLQPDSYGLEVHYYKDDSLALAQTMHDIFISEENLQKWDTKDRGMIKSRFYVINHTEAPSILIEIGFISNETERSKLLTKQRQEEIVESIAKGILEYLGIK